MAEPNQTDTAQPAAAKPHGAPVPQKIEPLRGLVKGLSENRLKLVLSSAADMGNGFAAVLPVGTKFKDCFDPAFWSHVAYKLRAGDKIEVHVDDMTFYGELYVRDVSAPGAQKLNNRAIVSQLLYVEFGPVAAADKTKTHEVVHLGPHLKWCVRALKDSRVVKEGCGTAEEAAAWMRSQAA